MKSRLTKIVLAGALAGNAILAAADCPDWNETTLSGNWNGVRSRLCDEGVTVKLTHKSDLLANVSGGVARGSAWLMNSEAAVSLDLDKFAGWGGTSAYVQYHVQHGDLSINDYTGSFAGVSNIETGANSGQFFQAWLQKNFVDDRFSVLAGLYAIDSEFYVTDTSGLFIEPPYGMSPEMAQTGRNGPPIFPMGALGVRVKYSAADFYLQGALTDGVPGKPHETQFKLNKGDGTLAVAEFGYTPQDGGKGAISKTAIGFWRYTARADDLTEVDSLANPLRHFDQGAYVLAEHTLMAKQGNPGQGLAGFVRLGVANKDVYQADWTGSLGLIYQGLFAGRDDDTAGVAVTTSHTSAKYRQLNVAKPYETQVEFAYRAQLRPWLALQPSVQYIRNPNMDPALKNAWVVGMRAEIGF